MEGCGLYFETKAEMREWQIVVQITSATSENCVEQSSRRASQGSPVLEPMRKAVFEHLSPRGHGASNRLHQLDGETDNDIWPFPFIPFSLLPERSRSRGMGDRWEAGESKTKYFTKEATHSYLWWNWKIGTWTRSFINMRLYKNTVDSQTN